MASLQTVRRWIMTGAVASITITGTMYGAGLKGQRDVKQERTRLQETSPEEMIAQLEVARADLVIKKNEMERKINNFTQRHLGKGQDGSR
ncbi:hypothetical protein P153DRAFT_287962 [Dothidotthia symphoricarpi CBS 119687]|uniref:Uncharacterized protein n=1 Tax=Dothidotthia symphoricarpi CBS 119687 TaxID=1392245 RepID=A0A6A6AIT4_9PLEO|nr:uncharacterized protein P153DRAFT_287962 [Dothidotthia symphoricarpi CBS 119687]KAF2131133.1 hypothetical protein P153DRAFT_287962 [Dothidotthia symphoricarpi CBS 119687]